MVAPKDVSEPAGATGELAIGCAGVAASVMIGATAPEDVAVVATGAGATGRPATGCDAIAPVGANVPNVAPVDEVDGVAGCVGAGAADGAATEPDTTFTGVEERPPARSNRMPRLSGWPSTASRRAMRMLMRGGTNRKSCPQPLMPTRLAAKARATQCWLR